MTAQFANNDKTMNTKALRQKILDLAIHGKLVPQDPNDEPASVLLERIKAEKERLIKEGKIKRSKQSKTAWDKQHYPFELPDGWCWTTIDNIYFVTKLAGFEYTEYFTKDAISPTNPVPIVRAQNVKMGRFIENNNEAITVELSEQLLRSALYKDCLLMTFIGAGVGDTCIFHSNKRNHLAPNVAKIEPFNEHINMEYALFFFMSSLGQLGVTNISKSTAQASLSMATIRELVIPIPPIKEQSRITNEVTKWFSLIDCIEENRNNLQETIKKAKSKILDLAIHGKLVPQDPMDEPASELLKRINPNAEITCDNQHYRNLPKGWCLINGKSLFEPMKSTKPNGTFFKYIDIDSIDNKRQRINKIKELKSKEAPSRACRYTEKGDIVFSMVRPYLRNIAKVTDGDCIASTGFYICRTSKLMLSDFCYYLMLSDYVVNGLNQFMKGDNSPSINKSNIEDWHYPLPPYKEQQRIVNAISKAFTTLDAISENL